MKVLSRLTDMKPCQKRKKDEEKILDETEMDISTKVSAAIASSWVVSIFSRHVPEDMAPYNPLPMLPGEDIVFRGSGTIIECEEDIVTHKYVSTIITAATLFERTNGLQPPQLKVDVYLPDGKLCKGKVFACDFHYNLAAVRIKTNLPLQTATLRSLDDAISINPSHHLHLPLQSSFQLRPHSNLFKIIPGTNIIRISRFYKPFDHLTITPGVFRSTSFHTKLHCNELYWVKTSEQFDHCGGPVVNSSAEVIGIAFYSSPFLPTNIISRWWKHFKSCGQYRRPWLGVAVANLHSSHLEFLGDFMIKFPNICTGVVVTKVAEDSPAFSRILPKDVIVECNGKLICSKLEFFDMIWDMVGESVEVKVLRASDGETLNLSLTVGETTPDKFYKWPQTGLVRI